MKRRRVESLSDTTSGEQASSPVAPVVDTPQQTRLSQLASSLLDDSGSSYRENPSAQSQQSEGDQSYDEALEKYSGRLDIHVGLLGALAHYTVN